MRGTVPASEVVDSAATSSLTTYKQTAERLFPGLLLTIVISAAALVLYQIEANVFAHPVIEALVIAILLGMAWRVALGLPARAKAGVKFASKPVLEMAIVLLGASVNLTVIMGAGVPLIASVIIAVILSLTISSFLGRALGLKSKLATLVAVGSSICGNSAIGAIAPVIDADPDDITSSIALANVLGVAQIFLLPSLIAIFGLTFSQYGILAGLSGYAVPQVVAATFSVSSVSGEIGTMVKLMRVLLLGPVALFFSLRYPHQSAANAPLHSKITRYIPWFVLGFILLAVLRSIGALPATLINPLHDLSTLLMILAMAGLGISVDMSNVRQVGLRVGLAVIGSVAVMITLSLVLINLFHLG